MSDKTQFDPASTYVLDDDDIVEESHTLELTGLAHQLMADLLASRAEDGELDEDEDEPDA